MTDTDAIIDPAHELVSSARVEGTPVYSRSGEKLGTIHSVMIHKRTGQVAYAVMSFGGFLSAGERVHPIPWEMLTYDQDRHGYVVDLTREIIQQAPSLSLDLADRPTDRAREQEFYHYYGMIPYW